MRAYVRVCVHECMCVHTTYMFVWVSVSNCVFVYVNELCVKTSPCKHDLAFSSFKEVITHQAQEPTMREFCPSGSSCHYCAHDLSLSLNIVSMNAAQSLRTEETTCTQRIKNLSPMTSYPVAHYRPFYATQ